MRCVNLSGQEDRTSYERRRVTESYWQRSRGSLLRGSNQTAVNGTRQLCRGLFIESRKHLWGDNHVFVGSR